MKVSVTYLLLVGFQMVATMAISLSLAQIKVNDDAIHFGEISTQEIKQLSLESTKDKLEFDITLADVTAQPHQLMITLGDGKGFDLPLFPKFNLDKKAVKLSLAASKIPVGIRNLDKILINLIVAEPGNKQNLYKPLGELIPTDDLKNLVPYKKSERIGIKPEIHHLFKEDPQTINPFFPIVFGGFDLVIFLGLMGLWTFGVGKDMFTNFLNTPITTFSHNVGFLGCLIGYEIVFFRYYLGSTIFTTLFHGAILAGPTIFLGSRSFRYLAHLRHIGKA